LFSNGVMPTTTSANRQPARTGTTPAGENGKLRLRPRKPTQFEDPGPSRGWRLDAELNAARLGELRSGPTGRKLELDGRGPGGGRFLNIHVRPGAGNRLTMPRTRSTALTHVQATTRPTHKVLNSEISARARRARWSPTTHLDGAGKRNAKKKGTLLPPEGRHGVTDYAWDHDQSPDPWGSTGDRATSTWITNGRTGQRVAQEHACERAQSVFFFVYIYDEEKKQGEKKMWAECWTPSPHSKPGLHPERLKIYGEPLIQRIRRNRATRTGFPHVRLRWATTTRHRRDISSGFDHRRYKYTGVGKIARSTIRPNPGAAT